MFFRFATGNKIRSSNKWRTLYFKDFAVLVTDSSGNPVANQSIKCVCITPKRYAKGRWFKSPIGAAFKSWVPKYSNAPDDPTCVSEDINKNGILDRGQRCKMRMVTDSLLQETLQQLNALLLVEPMVLLTSR